MGKSKGGGLARLPKSQKCKFLIGPVESWFMSCTTDIWTQPEWSTTIKSTGYPPAGHDLVMDCDKTQSENTKLSYFVYGSIGCFCYGEIHHRHRDTMTNETSEISSNTGNNSNLHIRPANLGALVNQLVDIRDDNSRVSCIRFLTPSPYPIIMALTESGSFIIHHCLKNETIIHLKKTEILTKYLGLVNEEATYTGEQNTKRPKFGITRQINAFVWPNATDVFLGISLTKEKTCLLLRMKFKDIVYPKSVNENPINRDTFVEHHQKIDLELQHYASPICSMESTMLNESICLIAVAMDDGYITVVVFDLSQGQKKRTIKLVRHSDQISSLSLDVSNLKKFPLGLLASVSRDGLMLVWDIENEFYFADFHTKIETVDAGPNSRSNSHINWFALSFINLKWTKQLFIAISNPDSGVTMLDIPENTRSKIRLRENKEAARKSNPKSKQLSSEMVPLKHSALIFNMEYDYHTETVITSSLDGNHILWKVNKPENDPNISAINLRPEFLIPAMLNNSRTHMLRSSPIREDLLCLALGKGGIRFHKISTNVIDCKFDMNLSCSLIARKISKSNVSPTSVAWHPSHEYRLAIGTLEGKVYRADITPRKATLIEAEYKPLVKSKSIVSENIQQRRKSDTLSSMNVDDIFDVNYEPVEREMMEKKTFQQGKTQHDGKEVRTDGIYSLCWGPNPASPQDVSKFSLYAIGSISHRLFIFYSGKDSSEKLTNYLDEFMDLSLPEAEDQASEVSWKSSMDLMALGTQDGRILIVSYLDEAHEDRCNNRLFKRILVVQGPFHSTFVQCLAWHPTMDKDEAHYYYLAASSNDSAVFVFNLKESILISDVKAKLKLELARNGDASDENIVQDSSSDLNCGSNAIDMKNSNTILSSYINKLDGHSKVISDIAWNPHELEELATSSFDRVCHVWSIGSGFLDAKILSKFSARERLFTLEWSLTDTDLLFTSGHDSTIWAWRPSENRLKVND